ncbi:MAG TPA: hypothetical protein VMZ74_16070 [Ramlibacter sp.]|nr:hypothetical protein [Ramlibacter sp.]
MQALRHARRIARLVLAWFALSLGVAIASPLIKHADIEFVCSGSSVKLIVKGDVGSKTASHTLDCPLCAGIDTPPAVASVDIPYAALLGRALQPIPSARIAALAFASLPARGPPLVPIA